MVNTVTNTIQIKTLRELNSSHEYVVIPDIHGELKVLEESVNFYKEEKLLLLGDFTDRGESTKKTFYLLKKLVESGKAFVILGNHDYKFYRWLKFWLADEEENKYYTLKFYGDLRIRHGFEQTLCEFSNESKEGKLKYALDFINFIENHVTVAAELKRGKEKHYFTHATITENVINNMSLKHSEIRHCNMTYAIEIEKLSKNVFEKFQNEKITVHIGHVFMYNEKQLFEASNKKHKLYMHDVGIGKRKFEEVVNNIYDFLIV